MKLLSTLRHWWRMFVHADIYGLDKLEEIKRNQELLDCSADESLREEIRQILRGDK